MRQAVQGDAVDLGHQRTRGQQRILAQFHGRGAGMRLHALHGDVIPALAQRGLHHADHAFVVLQHGALLDVRLEVGPHGGCCAGLARVADRGEGFGHAHALGVSLGERMLQREGPANTPEPIITGTNREPSSLVHTATSMGARVRTPAALSVRTTSRPAITP